MELIITNMVLVAFMWGMFLYMDNVKELVLCFDDVCSQICSVYLLAFMSSALRTIDLLLCLLDWVGSSQCFVRVALRFGQFKFLL